jgi:hypothetical protein
VHKGVHLGSVAVVALALGASACGGAGPPREQAPVPRPAPLRLPPGDVPGTAVAGRFVDARGRTVADVHELAAAGSGPSRVRLLVGRSKTGGPCVGLRTAAGERSLDCFAAWEHPPLVVRAGAGGRQKASTGWIAVAGIVSGDVDAVEVETQFGRRLAPSLRRYRDFPWRAFALLTRKPDLATTLVARAGTEPVASFDFGWMYTAPCEDPSRACKNGAAHAWSRAADPVAAAAGWADSRSAQAIAFRDPAVRRLVGGRSYTVADVMGWSTCQGNEIGAVLTLRFMQPFDFRGEVPYVDEWERSGSAAYRSGRLDLEAKKIRTFDIWVDVVDARVAGIELDTPLLYDEDIPPPDVRRSRVVSEPVPYLTDDPAACPPNTD